MTRVVIPGRRGKKACQYKSLKYHNNRHRPRGFENASGEKDRRRSFRDQLGQLARDSFSLLFLSLVLGAPSIIQDINAPRDYPQYKHQKCPRDLGTIKAPLNSDPKFFIQEVLWSKTSFAKSSSSSTSNKIES